MKAIVKSNWPNAKKGQVVEVTERQIQLYPNHLEAAPESLRVVVEAKKEDVTQDDQAPDVGDSYTREQLESIESIKELREIAEPLGVKGRGMSELVEEILKAQSE